MLNLAENLFYTSRERSGVRFKITITLRDLRHWNRQRVENQLTVNAFAAFLRIGYAFLGREEGSGDFPHEKRDFSIFRDGSGEKFLRLTSISPLS